MDCMRKTFGMDVLLDGRFQTVAPLNHGSFGMVFMAKDITTGSLCAIKCLTKPSAAENASMEEVSIDERSEELAIHAKIGRHANIVNLLHAFESKHHTYLVLEFCGNGDLYEAIRLNKGPLETEHVRDFMLQLVSAVECLHSKGIYHRDIKPENIFLTHSGSMKLGDFGLATTEVWSTEFGVGSDRYMAPEQFACGNGYDNGYSPAAADIWAIGICLLNVLFSRNPFATPTTADPLFADFARDRESLFDVFPNMSQDAFEVLRHSLALDPSKRSLSNVRHALETALSFTTDDESLDEFCTEDREPVPATLNREPLRTPSITSPQIDNGGCFPWAKALHATPQKHQRQLSVIPDNESYSDDLFPESRDTDNKSWYTSTETDATSLTSTADSGLGMSYKSINFSRDEFSHYASSRPVQISSSVPIKGSRAMASVYGNTDEIFSKSWSDLWEEDEEEEHQQRSYFEDAEAVDIERVATAKPREPSPLSAVTAAIDIKDFSHRSSTPRAGLTELKSTSIRSNSPEASRHRLFGSTKDVAASAPQKYSPPSKRSNSFMDKWTVLGNLRRGNDTRPAVPETPRKPVPQKPADNPDKPVSTSLTSGGKKTRERTTSWRKGIDASPAYQHTNTSGLWARKNSFNTTYIYNDLWQSSRDWRQHPDPHHLFSSPQSKPRTQSSTCAQQVLRSTKQHDDGLEDDIGDLEWVGGWDNLHL